MINEETGEVLEGSDMSTRNGRLFKKDPAINVISKEEFEERIDKVFHLLWKTLSKSFGPYGAPTLIYNYPFSHVTKDGYTIMKNLSMDASETKVDQAIADMASDICGRLNYSVGDGTTSAVIATNSIYQRYLRCRELLNKKFFLPRDIIKFYDDLKVKIIEKMTPHIVPIQTSDLEQLKKNIHDVVYISSNGDQVITDYISDLYGELGSPAITCMLAPDGITKKRLIEGYKYDLIITDRLYINTDENTANYENSDVIIFGTKVTKDVYVNIIKPLSIVSRQRGRHLIVAAPSYDEVALQQTISVELNAEYKTRHDITTVLTVYHASSAHARKLITDFATLMNTTVIDRSLLEIITGLVSTGMPVEKIFNVDGRNIDNLVCVATNNEQFISYIKGVDTLHEGYVPIVDLMPDLPQDVTPIDLGFVKKCSLGLKTSHFTDLVFDKKRYELILKDAEVDLEEKEKKYQKMGTFNIEVSQAQERLYALRLKMGVIEVGADSELSQKLIKDAVDDAIKAASSAFKYGTVLGCNTNLIQAIYEIFRESAVDSIDSILTGILLEGFIDVYRTVLGNAFGDFSVSFSNTVGNNDGKIFDTDISKTLEQLSDELNKRTGKNLNDIFTDQTLLYSATKVCYSLYNELSIHSLIVWYSVISNSVLDISKFKFTNDVVNSSQTDSEILIATVDLISLLIVGNQMVVTQKHNF